MTPTAPVTAVITIITSETETDSSMANYSRPYKRGDKRPRKFFRKRNTGGAPLNKTQKEQVKKLLTSRLDMKCAYPTSALWVPNTTLATTLTAFPEDYSLSNIKRFDDTAMTDKDKTRIGDTVKIHRIRIQGSMAEPSEVRNIWRFMVVRWAKNDFTDIDLNSVLQDNATNGAPLSFIDHNSPYQILWDETSTIGTGSGLLPIQKFSWDKKFKTPLTVAFDPSTDGGTYSETQQGLIRVYACCTTGTTCVTRFTWQVYFTDN